MQANTYKGLTAKRLLCRASRRRDETNDGASFHDRCISISDGGWTEDGFGYTVSLAMTTNEAIAFSTQIPVPQLLSRNHLHELRLRYGAD